MDDPLIHDKPALSIISGPVATRESQVSNGMLTKKSYQNDGSDAYPRVLRILATNEVKPLRLVAY